MFKFIKKEKKEKTRNMSRDSGRTAQ